MKKISEHKMKKIFKEILKPEKPFEQWAYENGIQLPERKPEKSKKPIFVKWVVATAASLIICLSIILPVLLIRNNPDSPTRYTDDNVHTERLESVNNLEDLEDFFKEKKYLFFDFSQVMNYMPVYHDIADDDETLILSYYIENCKISFKNDNNNGFKVSYRICIYSDYEFLYFLDYTDLENSFNIAEIKINFENKEIENTNATYVNFTYNNYFYYFKIEYAGVTELTEENLQIFLSSLF